jgi:hypothetical protein
VTITVTSKSAIEVIASADAPDDRERVQRRLIGGQP